VRYVRIIVVIALIGSIFGNFILWKKQARNQMKLKVNDQVTTVKAYEDWMSAHYGRPAAAGIAQYSLIMQAAAKAGFKPNKSEIEQELQDAQDIRPPLAVQYRIAPWSRTDAFMAKEQDKAFAFLLTKDVKATDDEIRDYFNANPGKWNKPDRIYMKVVQCLDAETASRAKELMEKVKDVTYVYQQLKPKAAVVGIDGTWMLPKPVGRKSPDAQVNAVASMRPGQVKIFSSPRLSLVVRLEKIEPGKVVTLDEVKDKVALEFKLTRSVPQKELLHKLWNAASIETDPPGLKKEIENLIFRDTTGK
jgi:hypothetical protein